MILTDGITPVTLPDDMQWNDEFRWSTTAAQHDNGLTGSLVIQHSARLAGRPITLINGDDFAWLERGDVEQLQAWADTPGQQLTLTMTDAVDRTVMFDHTQQAVDAQMVRHIAPPIATDPYLITIRLIEVA